MDFLSGRNRNSEIHCPAQIWRLAGGRVHSALPLSFTRTQVTDLRVSSNSLGILLVVELMGDSYLVWKCTPEAKIFFRLKKCIVVQNKPRALKVFFEPKTKIRWHTLF